MSRTETMIIGEKNFPTGTSTGSPEFTRLSTKSWCPVMKRLQNKRLPKFRALALSLPLWLRANARNVSHMFFFNQSCVSPRTPTQSEQFNLWRAACTLFIYEFGNIWTHWTESPREWQTNLTSQATNRAALTSTKDRVKGAPSPSLSMSLERFDSKAPHAMPAKFKLEGSCRQYMTSVTTKKSADWDARAIFCADISSPITSCQMVCFRSAIICLAMVDSVLMIPHFQEQIDNGGTSNVRLWKRT